MYMSAFVSDGKLVIVVVNEGGSASQSISINGGSVSSLKAFVFVFLLKCFLNCIQSLISVKKILDFFG